ncbi:MAG: hypothetical protein WBN93_15125 [Acidimicrobiia bacterium]
MTKNDSRTIAIELFGRVQALFPHLQMKLETDHPHVDINMEIPKQRGLDFDVNLNLQNNDELHLSAGDFWVEWFPCTEPRKVKEYLAAVEGLMTGQYRILEHRRGRKAVKAELQQPVGQNWQTIATWSTLRLPSFKRISFTVIRNEGALNK